MIIKDSIKEKIEALVEFRKEMASAIEESQENIYKNELPMDPQTRFENRYIFPVLRPFHHHSQPNMELLLYLEIP